MERFWFETSSYCVMHIKSCLINVFICVYVCKFASSNCVMAMAMTTTSSIFGATSHTEFVSSFFVVVHKWQRTRNKQAEGSQENVTLSHFKMFCEDFDCNYHQLIDFRRVFLYGRCMCSHIEQYLCSIVALQCLCEKTATSAVESEKGAAEKKTTKNRYDEYK